MTPEQAVKVLKGRDIYKFAKLTLDSVFNEKKWD